MKRKQLPVKTTNPWDEMRALAKRMENVKDPSPADVDRFRHLVAETPGFLTFEVSSMQSLRSHLIKKITDGMMRGFMLAEVDKLKNELGYDEALPLERLLIDHILTVWLRLNHAENAYNQKVVNASITFREGEYWDSRLTTAQSRYLRAIETLARVRRMARITPALQINIAREGGQQVNVQGDSNGEKSPMITDPQPKAMP